MQAARHSLETAGAALRCDELYSAGHLLAHLWNLGSDNTELQSWSFHNFGGVVAGGREELSAPFNPLATRRKQWFVAASVCSPAGASSGAGRWTFATSRPWQVSIAKVLLGVFGVAVVVVVIAVPTAIFLNGESDIPLKW